MSEDPPLIMRVKVAPQTVGECWQRWTDVLLQEFFISRTQTYTEPNDAQKLLLLLIL